MGDVNEEDRDRKSRITEFLEAETNNSYVEKIKHAINDGHFRLIVSVNDLRNFDRDLARELFRRPRYLIAQFQEASKDIAKNDVSLDKLLLNNDILVGFDGSFGLNAVSPRGLTSALLNSLVIVEGIVTKCSSVRPKLVQSVHLNEKSKKYIKRDYRDATALDIGMKDATNDNKMKLPTSSVMPTVAGENKDEHLDLEFGMCKYKDYQTIVLQEMPERARVGQLPRSIEIIVENDLVDRIKPGDRAQCVGVYRPLASVKGGQTDGIFRSVLLCNNIMVIGKEVGAVKLTGNDVGNIRALSERKDVLTLLARSLCPSIFGHEHIKRALVLQLLGGCERNLENGAHLRGDINVMMVGDPSTAKSQLLRAVLDIAPLAVSTTGRGSSGVGLTAAVTSDSETGERRLEAGAMVLADRGVVCIDEFDKMSEKDRVAIHEVMEQQTVTIAKAGINASLNARCSVLAAANPIYGQYNREETPQRNIGLPDSLLSRFDLLFIVLDQLDASLDRTLAEHVVKSHQYRRPGTIMEPEPLNQSSSITFDDDADGPRDTPMWQRGGRGAESSKGDGSAGDVLTKSFLRKYVHYAKARCVPEMSPEAMESIAAAYAGMRSKQSNKNLPVTARSLETLIRLSSAHAKARLSSVVSEEDVEGAVALVNFVLFHEASNPNVGDALDEEEVRDKRPKQAGDEKSAKRPRTSLLDKAAHSKAVREALRNYSEQGVESISVDELMAQLNREAAGSLYSSETVAQLMDELQTENKVMVDEGAIHIL